MDGGAYCTLTPVVLSRGVLHAGGPYQCPNTRIRGRAMATNTPPNGAFRGFGAPQVEFAAELQVARVAEALGMSPAELRRALAVPRGRRHADRPGPARERRRRRRSWSAPPRPPSTSASASSASQTRARALGPGRRSGRGCIDASGHASGIGLALAWHGAGFTGRGEVHLASVAGVELGDDGIVRVLIASTEIGQGTKTIFPMLAAEALGIEPDEVEMAPVDTSLVPDSGPTVASRTAMVVGGLVIKAAAAAARDRRGAERRRRSPRPIAHDAAAHGATRIDQRFEPYAGRRLRRDDLHGRRLPGVRVGLRGGRGGRRPRHRRGPRALRRLRGRRRPGHPSGPRRGPGGGRHAPGGGLRHHRGDEARGRALPQRPARHLPHPDLARCAAHHARSSSRSPSAARRTAPRASASCPWTSSRRRSSTPSTTRSGSGSRSCRPRPERILAALAGRHVVTRAGEAASARRSARPSASRSTASRARSPCRACAACSTCCARTSA